MMVIKHSDKIWSAIQQSVKSTANGMIDIENEWEDHFDH